MQQLYAQAVADGTGCECDFRITRPDGEQRWISSRATVVRDSVGRSVKMVGISMDNTQRMVAEAELRNSEERFRTIFELAWGALAYIDPNGAWQRVNRSLCDLLGYRAEELYAMTFQQLTHPDDLPANLQLLQRMLAGEIDRYEVEKRVRHKDGRYIWVRARTSLQRREDGEPEHLISVFEDIAAERCEHERLEAHIAGLEARLAQKA
ncbi:putative diguanylate cyclase YegE [compost metagenome]